MLPRVALHHPQNIEREYTRTVNAYMAMLNRTLAEHLPTIRRTMASTRRAMERAKARSEIRHDAFDEFSEMFYGMNDVIMNTFMRVQRDFERRARMFNLEGRLDAIWTWTPKRRRGRWRAGLPA